MCHIYLRVVLYLYTRCTNNCRVLLLSKKKSHRKSHDPPTRFVKLSKDRIKKFKKHSWFVGSSFIVGPAFYEVPQTTTRLFFSTFWGLARNFNGFFNIKYHLVVSWGWILVSTFILSKLFTMKIILWINVLYV